jgi:hypothetical protein
MHLWRDTDIKNPVDVELQGILDFWLRRTLLLYDGILRMDSKKEILVKT